MFVRSGRSDLTQETSTENLWLYSKDSPNSKGSDCRKPGRAALQCIELSSLCNSKNATGTERLITRRTSVDHTLKSWGRNALGRAFHGQSSNRTAIDSPRGNFSARLNIKEGLSIFVFVSQVGIFHRPTTHQTNLGAAGAGVRLSGISGVQFEERDLYFEECDLYQGFALATPLKRGDIARLQPLPVPSTKPLERSRRAGSGTPERRALIRNVFPTPCHDRRLA